MYISVFALLMIKQLLNRADVVHLMPLLLISIILVSIMFRFLFKAFYVTILCSATFIFLLISAISTNKKNIKNNLCENLTDLPLCTMDNEKKNLLKYIKTHISANESFYVGVFNHDKFLINDVIFYFLCDANISTKYTELHPGLTNTKEIQKEIVAELSQNNQYIILAENYWYENNKTNIDYHVDLLDSYIQKNYTQVYSNKTYKVLKK
jgi:hypothetical protein